MYEGKRVAIAGFGAEGRSAFEYFRRHGAHQLVIFDEAASLGESLPDGAGGEIGPGSLERITGFDVVSRTPALRPERIPTNNRRVTSVTREFFSRSPAPIVGVTGTKGKGTTATLIGLILEKAGMRSHVVGNVGVPALDVIDGLLPDDVVVYELSSFQLWDLERSPRVAVILMVEEDHQDVHESLEEYVRAKHNITSHQSAEDVVIYHPTNPLSADVAAGSLGKKLRYLTPQAAYVAEERIWIAEQEVCPVSATPLPGPHNLENVCAAVSAAWQFTKDLEVIGEAIREFRGLEHRLEFVREVGGIRYFDDSVATAVAAARAATLAFDEPKIMIYGGSDKGASFTTLGRTAAAAGVKRVLLIGTTGPKIAEALADAGFHDYEFVNGDMDSVVARARNVAHRGDVVILSPGCASLDMFRSYEDRGRQFKESVERI